MSQAPQLIGLRVGHLQAKMMENSNAIRFENRHLNEVTRQA